MNKLFPNDSITKCSGFIHEITRYDKDTENVMYFARVGLIIGSVHDGSQWKGDIVNCDLLVGSSVKKFAECLLGSESIFKSQRVGFTIRNLKFTPGIYKEKPVLNSSGIIEKISVGTLIEN